MADGGSDYFHRIRRTDTQMSSPIENGILSLRLSDDLAVRVVRAAEYREKPVDRWAVGWLRTCCGIDERGMHPSMLESTAESRRK